jgi:hypothetical protein
MVRTRIPQRAVTQQPRQKGNVAPWTGDLCLSGSGGLGSSQKGALRFRPCIIGYPFKGANRRINGLGIRSDFDVPIIIVFAASDRAAWRRSFGIGIGAIVVYGSAPTAHSITAHCPPAHDEHNDITAHCPPAYDEDSDALAGAALGSPSVMSNRQFVAGALRGPRGLLWVVFLLIFGRLNGLFASTRNHPWRRL